jgi:predicted N-acetyltransferase YhbS
MITIRKEKPSDTAAREALLDAAFGDARFAKTCERFREGRLPASNLAFVASDDKAVIGTVRLWSIKAGTAGASLLLGPLAVSETHQSQGVGGKIMRAALTRARMMGHRSILLVGDAAYYERFGFSADLTLGLDLPGAVDRARFLGLELEDGALQGASGLVEATGEHDRVSSFRHPAHAQSELVAA